MKNSMKNIWTIASRDFRSYFTSPIAYIVMGAFLGVMGWMFFNILEYYFEHVRQFQQMGGMGGKLPSLTDGVLRPLYNNMNVILLFLMPFVTMRLIAEEKKNQSLVLLMTAPVKLSEIVIGKYLAAFMLVNVMLLITLVYPITLFMTTNVQVGPVVTCYLGTVLIASCYLSLGVLFSAVTEHQIVAGALTFGALLFFWLISWAANSAGAVEGAILEYISIIGHYQNFSRGILSSADAIYYLSFTGLALFMTYKILDSYRWRA